jgi:hypothetical protein
MPKYRVCQPYFAIGLYNNEKVVEADSREAATALVATHLVPYQAREDDPDHDDDHEGGGAVRDGDDWTWDETHVVIRTFYDDYESVESLYERKPQPRLWAHAILTPEEQARKTADFSARDERARREEEEQREADQREEDEQRRRKDDPKVVALPLDAVPLTSEPEDDKSPPITFKDVRAAKAKVREIIQRIVDATNDDDPLDVYLAQIYLLADQITECGAPAAKDEAVMAFMATMLRTFVQQMRDAQHTSEVPA